jgi:tetratricopeptide (TPR) repeat protein
MQARFEEARRELEIALRLDPLSLIINEGVGYLELLARRYDEAIKCYEKTLELDRSFYKAYTAIGRALSLQGRYREAVEMFEKGRWLGGDVPSILAALAHSRSLAGDRAGAVALLEELRAISGKTYVPSTCFALVHVGLGEKEAALDWLEMGGERRELPLATMGVHPIYDELRSAPRFQALLARIGLPQRVRDRHGTAP